MSLGSPQDWNLDCLVPYPPVARAILGSLGEQGSLAFGGLKKKTENKTDSLAFGIFRKTENKTGRKKEQSHVKHGASNHYVAKAGARLYHPSTKVPGQRLCPPTSGCSLKPRRLSSLASGAFPFPGSSLPFCPGYSQHKHPAPSPSHNPHPTDWQRGLSRYLQQEQTHASSCLLSGCGVKKNQTQLPFWTLLPRSQNSPGQVEHRRPQGITRNEEQRAGQKGGWGSSVVIASLGTPSLGGSQSPGEIGWNRAAQPPGPPPGSLPHWQMCRGRPPFPAPVSLNSLPLL